MAKNQIYAVAAPEEAQDPALPQSRISRLQLALDRSLERRPELLLLVTASALVEQSRAEVAGSGFPMERETLLELAWDSFQALAFRFFPGSLSLCPSQFSLRLEMLSFSELIFSFPVASLASRSVISPVLLAQQLVQAFRSVLTLGLVLLRRIFSPLSLSQSGWAIPPASAMCQFSFSTCLRPALLWQSGSVISLVSARACAPCGVFLPIARPWAFPHR